MSNQSTYNLTKTNKRVDNLNKLSGLINQNTWSKTIDYALDKTLVLESVKEQLPSLLSKLELLNLSEEDKQVIKIMKEL